MLSSILLFFSTLFLATFSLAAPQEDISARAVVNAGRPVATGACCIAGVSKKGDTCTDAAGAKKVCKVANSAGCNAALTCA